MTMLLDPAKDINIGTAGYSCRQAPPRVGTALSILKKRLGL
jgi:hypothetical protein